MYGIVCRQVAPTHNFLRLRITYKFFLYCIVVLASVDFSSFHSFKRTVKLTDLSDIMRDILWLTIKTWLAY